MKMKTPDKQLRELLSEPSKHSDPKDKKELHCQVKGILTLTITPFNHDCICQLLIRNIVSYDLVKTINFSMTEIRWKNYSKTSFYPLSKL